MEACSLSPSLSIFESPPLDGSRTGLVVVTVVREGAGFDKTRVWAVWLVLSVLLLSAMLHN